MLAYTATVEQLRWQVTGIEDELRGQLHGLSSTFFMKVFFIASFLFVLSISNKILSHPL